MNDFGTNGLSDKMPRDENFEEVIVNRCKTVMNSKHEKEKFITDPNFNSDNDYESKECRANNISDNKKKLDDVCTVQNDDDKANGMIISLVETSHTCLQNGNGENTNVQCCDVSNYETVMLDAHTNSDCTKYERTMSDIVCENNGCYSNGFECRRMDECSNNKTVVLDEISPAVLVQLEQHKHNIQELKKTVERLNNERANLEIEASHTTCLSQIDQYQREIELLKQEHQLDMRAQTTMKLEFDNMKKQYEMANKEREVIVMRYAVSEMEVINQRKEFESLEKKYKESLKEKEGLSSKLKSVMIEKARISQLLDNKCSELANTQRDVEKLKEELNTRDIKIKWTQNKLKTEIESHKESEAQVEKLSSTILEAKAEVEKAKKDSELAIKQFQFSQENKAYVLEQQLKEQQAQLILERHNLEDKENINKQLLHEVDTLRNKHLLLIDENNALKLKVCSIEKERQDNEHAVARLRESIEKSSHEVDELHEKTSAMETIKLQLQQEREKVAILQTDIAQLRTSNDELLQDMASCREREADMLEFTQKVTAKNVRLQSEYSCIEAKARQLESEEEPLQRKVDELIEKINLLQKELNKERCDRCEEKKLVARHLAEKTARVELLTKEVDELKGENQVMKHKHAVTLRELNREVVQYRKRLEQLENSSGSDSLCQGSRASSCTSLNDSVTTLNTQLEPDKQTMIDRILKLQKENVRLREKIDFLEEHSKQLVAELQKKTRVLQSYILREESGTLTSGSMDFHKAELAKHGGIMASVYGSKAMDDTMTLELSLEINRKLQAVLEDTLLKNITLKENIDTLGDEIRRLSKKS